MFVTIASLNKAIQAIWGIIDQEPDNGVIVNIVVDGVNADISTLAANAINCSFPFEQSEIPDIHIYRVALQLAQ